MKNLLQALMITLLSFTSFASYAAGDQSTKPLYYVIEEPFTINFLRQSEEKARYLQIKVALKSNDPAILNSADSNLPMIQDSLRILFAEQNMNTVKSIEGRSRLQQEAYERIKAIFEEETGNSNLEAVYFTTFLWQ
ncbi:MULTISPECIES: flagellar basal body-associated FliL family protein [unclassified Methylophaga]|jgi:flagellar FliL protein|uniref:flagellar basal body-associated FliL family protein n=1 Tax=unclassified Methylophaga TaxID=2629249 RepID=UPI000C90AC94|nr:MULTISPECIES: flagellar basal body-associated FliL family protein [unclassified Methylophaga]MAK66492.1 flagellar basal body protein FliL [Methylophaga sp.]MAY17185.1 flagellar basal body protein FliL [Methylophaga sp.]MBN46021.1 flagellar basal body protein FliL [Methylophaga sp.]HAO23951.1 flagellar basal body protein FliL [Methylophaga sp.]HCD06438.1 flagellar basal body protein FliL [Methylophaga sp.]|tara:strand:- start:10163 stop:10570 length:408 start_codon:yes stop_codon:yes gene_type:complete